MLDDDGLVLHSGLFNECPCGLHGVLELGSMGYS